ncbi:MAG: ribonuclease III [Clostridia bacterium]|nr:ribonuclease III [Clostridia bacterium]
MLDLHDVTTPALAYLGDCVLEMFVRTYLVSELGLSTSAHLNREALKFVCAAAQSKAMDAIQPHLTEEETAVFKRGRNMGHGNVPKNASVKDYRRATGMEVLFGYLSLSGQEERARELFRIGYGLDGKTSDVSEN